MFRQVISGIGFENPFLVASGPSTSNRKLLSRALDMGWGGVVTKTLVLDEGIIQNVTPRLIGVKRQTGNCFGLVNIELASDRKIAEWQKDISYLKKTYPHKVIVASVMAEGTNSGSWKKIASLVSDSGADIIELNLSCPHGMPEFEMGAAVGQNPDLVGKVTSWVREICKIPIWVKLTANVTDIVTPARFARDNGADGLVAINSINSIAGVDLETLLPMPTVGNSGTSGGYSGPAIKPIALKAVADLAQSLHMPVSGIGGIAQAKDAIEFLLLGANTVQICTAVMFEGFQIIGRLLDGLKEFMIKHKFEHIEDFVGKSVEYLRPIGDLNRKRIVARIDKNLCVSCGKCKFACDDSANEAICLKAPKEYEIKANDCIGCGLCKQVCPRDNCISFS